MISHLRDVHRSHRLQSFVLPYRLRGFPKRQRGDFVFTVVRDPMSAARAAYLEVSRRSPPARPGDAATFRALSCSDERSAQQRYLAFLSDVEASRDLGTETFHANPQALKLSVASYIDAFVLVERLASDGPHSGQLLARRSGVSLASMGAAPPRHVTASTARSPCSFNTTQEIERRICELYRADYACLPFEMPAVCLSAPKQ